MGMWSGIKYALNSTLGTNKFAPLDKLLTRRTVLAGNDILWETTMGSKSVSVPQNYSKGESVFGEIISLYNDNLVGTINIQTKVKVVRSAYSGGTLGDAVIGKVHLYKNNELIASSSEKNVSTGENRQEVSASFDISFMGVSINAGDELKIAFEIKKDSSYTNSPVAGGYITGNNNPLTINGALGDYLNITGSYL